MYTIFACDTNNLKDLLESLGYTVVEEGENPTIYKIVVEGTDVQITNPGMTKAQVAKTLTSLETKPSLVIATGNCASICCPVRVGTMAVAACAVQHDVNFRPVGYRRGYIPALDKGYFKSSDALMTLAKYTIDEKKYCGRKGRYASGDQFIACHNKAERIKQNFCSYFIDTETGTIAELCSEEEIPWISVKGVSNYADKNAPRMCDIYAKTANSASLKVALAMIENLVTIA